MKRKQEYAGGGGERGHFNPIDGSPGNVQKKIGEKRSYPSCSCSAAEKRWAVILF